MSHRGVNPAGAANVTAPMKLWFTHVLVCAAPLVLLAGCMTLGGDSLPIAAPRDDSDSYELVEQRDVSVSGCEYDYRVYRPLIPRTPTSIMLGHGFLRDQDNMIGLSRALANEGVTVVTLDFCNMRPWNGHHETNALDMRALAEKLGIAGDIVFGGFSAGALAAVLAADNDTRAILALDLVDQDDLGLSAIRKLTTPLVGLSGPASSCNANSNGMALYNSRAGDTVSNLINVTGASHCEFESPSNWLCEIACGDEDDRQADTIERRGIIKQAIYSLTPFLAAQ